MLSIQRQMVYYDNAFIYEADKGLDSVFVYEDIIIIRDQNGNLMGFSTKGNKLWMIKNTSFVIGDKTGLYYRCSDIPADAQIDKNGKLIYGGGHFL